MRHQVALLPGILITVGCTTRHSSVCSRVLARRIPSESGRAHQTGYLSAFWFLGHSSCDKGVYEILTRPELIGVISTGRGLPDGPSWAAPHVCRQCLGSLIRFQECTANYASDAGMDLEEPDLPDISSTAQVQIAS